MAVGDAFVGTASLANDATTNIQPASGNEVALHYVLAVGAGELYVTDGTNTILIASTSTGNIWYGGSIRLTNGQYAYYKNKSGSTQKVCWSAVYTKVSA
jgi:hypothetical protein